MLFWVYHREHAFLGYTIESMLFLLLVLFHYHNTVSLFYFKIQIRYIAGQRVVIFRIIVLKGTKS